MRAAIKFLSIFLLLVFSFCNKENNYLISGNISGVSDSTILYLRNVATDTDIDTTYIVDGKFSFKEGHFDHPPEQLMLLAIVDQQIKTTNLLIGNDEVTIKADISDFPWNVQISGSPTQDNYNETE